MWGTDGGGHLHSKNRPVLYNQHEVTYMQKLYYCSSCQYTHGCGALASWTARLTTVCLDDRDYKSFISPIITALITTISFTFPSNNSLVLVSYIGQAHAYLQCNSKLL